MLRRTHGDLKAAPNAGTLAIADARPIDDMRGTAEFRRHVVGVLTRRALAIAATRAKANI